MNILFPLVISSSIMEDINTCQTKFFRSWIQKLKPSRNEHLIAGGLLAKSLEITRAAYYNDSLDSEAAIEKGYNFILEQDQIESSTKNITALAFAFKRYFRTFPLEGNLKPAILVNEKYAIEYPFSLDTGISHPDFPEINIRFSGKLDYIGVKEDFKGDKTLYIVDDKTTGSVKRKAGSKEVDIAFEEAAYSTRGQFIGYHYAAHKIGIPTERTLVRRLPLLKEPEPPYELEICINQYMIDCWEYSFLSIVKEIKERYLYYKNSKDIIRSFPKTYSENCNSFHKKCPFYSGCLSLEGNQMLETIFEQKVGYPEYGDGSNTISLNEYKEFLENLI